MFVRLGRKSLPGKNSLLRKLVNYGQKSFITLAPGRLYKHFMRITYGPATIRCAIILCMRASIQCFIIALAYLASAVSYCHKMFLKLTPGENVMKLFMDVIYKFS